MKLSNNQIKTLESANRIIEKMIMEEQSAYTSPAMVKQYLQTKLAHLEHEVFTVMFLDNRHQLISCDEMFRGTIDGASVYPREVAKAALNHNAAAVIFAHNHPSGGSVPSTADKMITNKLRDALALFDVRVVDHIIVGKNTYSFAENGLI